MNTSEQRQRNIPEPGWKMPETSTKMNLGKICRTNRVETAGMINLENFTSTKITTHELGPVGTVGRVDLEKMGANGSFTRRHARRRRRRVRSTRRGTGGAWGRVVGPFLVKFSGEARPLIPSRSVWFIFGLDKDLAMQRRKGGMAARVCGMLD